MADPLHVLSARLIPGPRGSIDAGLLGLARVELEGGWILEHVAIRRRRTGGAYVAFPAKDDRRGRRSYPFRPACERARRAFEAQVLSLLAEDIAALERDQRGGARDRADLRRGARAAGEGRP